MTVYYKSRQWGRDVDLDDLYVRKSIFNSGDFWIWGENLSGQFIDGTITSRSSPIQILTRGNNWKQIDLSTVHFFGVKTDGTLWSGGDNGNGALGNNSTNPFAFSSPIQTIARGNDWYQVTSNYQIAQGIKSDGTLWSWGRGYSAGLHGNNTGDVNRLSPVQTITASTDWRYLGGVGCAIKSDNSLWLWGFNTYGALGDNTTTNRSSPVQTVTVSKDWRIASRRDNIVAAIKTNGTLWVWGNNTDGQLGTNNTTNRSSPVQTITGGNNWKAVSVTNDYMAAIKTDGTLWSWGANLSGQLGINSTSSRSSPVQTVAGGSNWRFVSTGLSNTTAAIKTDGTLWVWGNNSYGQLGDNSTTQRNSPVQTVAGGSNWTFISMGQRGAVGIRS